jgi:hypothetical protein
MQRRPLSQQKDNGLVFSKGYLFSFNVNLIFIVGSPLSSLKKNTMKLDDGVSPIGSDFRDLLAEFVEV